MSENGGSNKDVVSIATLSDRSSDKWSRKESVSTHRDNDKPCSLGDVLARDPRPSAVRISVDREMFETSNVVPLRGSVSSFSSSIQLNRRTLNKTLYHLPGRNSFNQLNSVLEDQFLGIMGRDKVVSPVDEAEHDLQSAVVNASLKRELMAGQANFCSRLVDARQFVGFFTMLTLYALFVPDIDQWLGDKSSTEVVTVLTNLVVFLFIFEIVAQSLGKPMYLCRAYFLLDLVAMLSLLPDTWMVIKIFDTDKLIAADGFMVDTLFSNASSSARMTRLTRLIRIVRVAALIPRVSALLGHGVANEDIEKLLDKKFRRIFASIDENQEQCIPRSTILACMAKIRANRPKKNALKRKGLNVVGFSEQSSSLVPWTFLKRRKTANLDVSKDKVAESSRSFEEHPEVEFDASGRRSSNSSVSSSSSSHKWKQKKSQQRRVSGQNTNGEEEPNAEEDFLDYEEFKQLMLQDDLVGSDLRQICKDELRTGTNTSNLTAHQTEQIGIKVAMGVLLLLFLWNLIKSVTTDLSAQRGLQYMGEFVHSKFPNISAGDEIDTFVHTNVQIWFEGAGTDPQSRKVLYLDLENYVYCNDIIRGNPCSPPSQAAPSFVWGMRDTLVSLEMDLRNSDHRLSDLYMVLDPDLSDLSLSEEELDRQTRSAAVVNIRDRTEEIAQYTILTTMSVIFIILAGILLLTKDMSFLSRYLLRPLRELADDMESIAQLHIDVVSENKDHEVDLGTSEIKHIRKTFEHMKKAILSWGKYVPWPVVQLMIRQNVEAELNVKEHEVTIFFSDIASFTSIVERIAPEQSLLLLSKYFNEMSNVTDDHDGVVLEFIGDAILSIFGEPIQNPDHPTMAVRCTLKMLAVLRKMNQWSKERNLPEVTIRCGLHTGKVLVGNMGFNTRMKYGIVGEEANIPARLEELNKSYDTNFLISESTLQKLQPDTFITRPIDCVYLRRTPGSDSEVIHQVVDKARRSGAGDHPMWPAAKLHAEAMELYFKRDFKQAAAMFENVSAMVHGLTTEEDRPSLMMVVRCESYISHPPPAQWKGVWDRGDELP